MTVRKRKVKDETPRFYVGDEVRWMSRGEPFLTFVVNEILPAAPGEGGPYYVGPVTTMSWRAVTLAWEIGMDVTVTESNPNTKLVLSKARATRFQRKVLA